MTHRHDRLRGHGEEGRTSLSETGHIADGTIPAETTGKDRATNNRDVTSRTNLTSSPMDLSRTVGSGAAGTDRDAGATRGKISNRAAPLLRRSPLSTRARTPLPDLIKKRARRGTYAWSWREGRARGRKATILASLRMYIRMEMHIVTRAHLSFYGSNVPRADQSRPFSAFSPQPSPLAGNNIDFHRSAASF